MIFADLQTKSIEQLQVLLAEKNEQLRNLRFKVTENQYKNVREIRKTRKLIAQINTLLCAKKAADSEVSE